MSATLASSAAPAARKRIHGIDICRSAAIVLAMSSHAMVEAKLWMFSESWPPATFVTLRFIMQMAPIIFIALFGAMLEIAYVPRYRAGHRADVTRRLLSRAVQCYLLYVLTVLTLLAVGIYSPGYTLRCILMAGVTPYTDILKFYAVALFLAPLLIQLRERIGYFGLIAIVIVVHASYPLISLIPEPPVVGAKDYLGPITGFIIGRGGHVGAPSVLHGFAVVLAGMAIGGSVIKLVNGEPEDRRRGVAWMAALSGVSAAAIIAFWDWSDPADTARRLTDMTIRNLNHPLYYACGTLTSIIGVLLCIWLFDFRGARWADGIKFMGAASLFTFSFGNILLYASPLQGASALSAHLIWLGLSALIVLQTWLFYALVTTAPWTERGGATKFVGVAVRAMTHRTQAMIDRVVTPLASLYARFAAGNAAAGKPALVQE